MHGIVFHGEREIEVAEFPDPTPGPDQVVVAIKASGMCGSDLHTYRGERRTAPLIGGHEPAGLVVAVGGLVPDGWLGRPVMVHHYFGCTRCDQCRSGWTQLCREGATAMGATAPGSHADFVTVPVGTVLPMPDGLSFPAAAAIGCGTGTAWGALKRLRLRGDDTIAIFGQGPVGLAATQLATAMGARVVALDVTKSRLARGFSHASRTDSLIQAVACSGSTRSRCARIAPSGIGSPVSFSHHSPRSTIACSPYRWNVNRAS